MTATSTRTSTPALEVDGVGVRYPETAVAVPAHVDLTLRPGEVVLLLGPSGCGKSTLTLTLNGLVPHSLPAEVSGTVRVTGTDTTTAEPAELATRVGVVFQDPDAQVVTGSVLDEVCFGGENLRLPVAEIEARAAAALAAVGLTGREDDDPDRLSGGGRQRLALACALAMRPRVLVLDEPTANLDPAGTRELYATLAGVVGEGTRAVLLVEHDLDEAAGLVDRVVVLDGAGRTVLTGPPRDVFGRHLDLLDRLGVWVPTAVRVAARLAAHDCHLDPVPLDADEAGRRLAALPDLPAPGPAARPAPKQAPRTAAGADGTPPVTVVSGLTVRYRDRTALDDVSLVVPAGDFLAVVGVNGAGKTTLGHAVAGVVPPPPGTVTTAGLDVGRAAPAELAARIGFVFQNPEHQFMTGSVADELALGLRLTGVDGTAVADRVDAYLDRFGLLDHRDRNPFLLSHGQKRRLSVASALVTGPRLLVLDEPTFGQDRLGAIRLLDLLDELHAAGTTVLVITHDLQLVADRAASVAVLGGGRLLAHGPVDTVLRDDALLAAAGLPAPPLRRIAVAAGRTHPAWGDVLRLADLP